MEEEKVKKYIGKKVLLVLNNGFKLTTTIPDFDGDSFDVIDKYGCPATVECEMISLIVAQGDF